MATSPIEVEIDGRRVTLSHLDKVLYPEDGFTKGQVIEYYRAIAPVLLPHLHQRPLTLKRYPDGVEGHFFYEKRCPSYRPPWVKTAPVWSEHNQDKVPYCVVNDLPTLVWAANLADLELHTSLSRFPQMAQPTMMVFDLDPGAPAGVLECAEVALWLKALFEQLKLQCFPKTSGSKGLQVYVPLNTRVTYDATKAFARAVAQLLEKQHPRKVVSNMRKNLRKGKVFIDWSQNDDHKTTVCVYSLRARERPTVSTPLHWGELEHALRKRAPDSLVFEHDEVLARVAREGDLFKPVLTLKQKLPTLPSLPA